MPSGRRAGVFLYQLGGSIPVELFSQNVYDDKKGIESGNKSTDGSFPGAVWQRAASSF